MTEDRELVALLKAGYADALEQLITRWRSRAEAYAVSILHDPHALMRQRRGTVGNGYFSDPAQGQTATLESKKTLHFKLLSHIIQTKERSFR